MSEKLKRPDIIELTEEQASCIFAGICWMAMGMTTEEFMEKWEAGEYEGVDLDEIPGLLDVWMALPLIGESGYDYLNATRP